MRKELVEVERVLSLISTAKEALVKSTENQNQLMQDILTSIEEINLYLYDCKDIKPASFEEKINNINFFADKIDSWLMLQYKELELRKKISTKVDYDFHKLIKRIEYNSREELVESVVKKLKDIRSASEKNYNIIINIYNSFESFWGAIDLDKGCIDLIINRVTQLKEHLEDFIWLYQTLADYRSKKVLYGIIHFWLTFDFEEKRTIKENNFADYFDFDLISCDEREVFVDLGAYNGDSALSFIENFGRYKRIYCYEITPASMKQMKDNLQEYENIVYRNVGVGKEAGTMYLSNSEAVDSNNQLTEEYGEAVQVVCLDEDIQEEITFLKMDIEGSEMDALEGAKNHICKEHPKLAICTYHNNHHIWEIPKKIKELSPDYKIYMRYNGSWNGALVSEFVTFAI